MSLDWWAYSVEEDCRGEAVTAGVGCPEGEGTAEVGCQGEEDLQRLDQGDCSANPRSVQIKRAQSIAKQGLDFQQCHWIGGLTRWRRTVRRRW